MANALQSRAGRQPVAGAVFDGRVRLVTSLRCAEDAYARTRLDDYAVNYGLARRVAIETEPRVLLVARRRSVSSALVSRRVGVGRALLPATETLVGLAQAPAQQQGQRTSKPHLVQVTTGHASAQGGGRA
jgi:hypothetical protein